MYCLWSSFHSQVTGRFLSEDTAAGDPIWPWTYNRYSYAWNNPLAYVDPTGHWPQWMTKAWSKVKEWASNYRWDVAAAGLADAILGTGEVIIGGTAVTLGCATVVFCGAAIAGGYAMVDGGSRIVSGAADIIGANDPDYQQGSYNLLKDGYQAVLGNDRGAVAYEAVSVVATLGAAVAFDYARAIGYDPEVAAGAKAVLQKTQAMEGPVIFWGKEEWTLEENLAAMEYVGACNCALDSGVRMERVPVPKELRDLASADAERWAAQNHVQAGYNAGHIPDTTWTGVPTPPGGYMALPASVNKSFGAQALRYPAGYRPTQFIFIPR